VGKFCIQYIHFQVTKKAITIITSTRTRLLGVLFETLNILLLQSKYIFLLCFVMNMDQHKVNSDIRGKDTRQNPYLHQTISNLPLHKLATYYMGMKVFNRLPI
jgi:hypothetical protein